MKNVAKWAGIVLAVLVVLVLCGFGWASCQAGSIMERQMTAHEVDFPIPFPLSEDEIAELRAERLAAMPAPPPPEPGADGEGTDGDAAGDGADAPPPPPPDPLEGVDLSAVALERAVARGEHLVRARYACVECHGEDFGGGTMVDDPALGTLLGPNITTGAGSRTLEFTADDWDNIVRHGIRGDGRPAIMPSEDYQRMSDRELSDIVAFIRSKPAVDATIAEPALGPLGKILVAMRALPLSVDLIPDHQATHAVEPPETAPTAEFGEHLIAVCTGCHRANLEGGPIASGDPNWIPAANITPHEQGIAGWTYEDFVTAIRDLRRPDGSAVREPMSLMQPYVQRMTDVELQALWAYLQTVEARPTGQ